MTYTPSKYWKWLNKRMKIMFKELGGYDNFKRTAGHIYNDDYISLHANEPRKLHNLDCGVLWNFLYSSLPKDLLDQFEEPLEGNPVTGMMFGRHVSIDLGCSILEYHTMSKFIDFNKINTIYEIGGGYGRTAYVITKLHPKIRYVLIDIEPSLSLAKRYLSSVAKWGNFDFRTPDSLVGKCDLFISIDCMAEMTRKQVYDYFSFINSNAIYFYFVTWLEAICAFDNIFWRFNDYPIREKWKRLLLQQHIRMGWIEALYKI